jgi:hypothetical protein
MGDLQSQTLPAISKLFQNIYIWHCRMKEYPRIYGLVFLWTYVFESVCAKQEGDKSAA